MNPRVIRWVAALAAALVALLPLALPGVLARFEDTTTNPGNRFRVGELVTPLPTVSPTVDPLPTVVCSPQPLPGVCPGQQPPSEPAPEQAPSTVDEPDSTASPADERLSPADELSPADQPAAGDEPSPGDESPSSADDATNGRPIEDTEQSPVPTAAATPSDPADRSGA